MRRKQEESGGGRGVVGAGRGVRERVGGGREQDVTIKAIERLSSRGAKTRGLIGVSQGPPKSSSVGARL